MPAKSAATEMTYTSVRDSVPASARSVVSERPGRSARPAASAASAGSVRVSRAVTAIAYFAPAQPSRGLNPLARSAST